MVFHSQILIEEENDKVIIRYINKNIENNNIEVKEKVSFIYKIFSCFI